MNKRKSIFAGVILAVVLLVGAASCAPGDLKAFEGILKNVDSLSGNVTITLSDNTTATFNLKDIDLSTIRKALGNASLKPGDNVTVKEGKHGEITEVKVRYAEVQGVIKSLTANVTATANVTTAARVASTANVTIGSVTINTTKGDITLRVTSATLIRGDGKDKPAFANLKVGQRIVVKYDVTTMTALSITVNAAGQIHDNHNNFSNQDNRTNNGKDQNNKNIQGKMGRED
jgi:preprotein translocase subunit YajC